MEHATASAVIRLAHHADVPAIVEMGQRFLAFSRYGQLFNPEPAHVEAAISGLLDSDWGHVVVATVDGKIVGFLLATLSTIWFAPEALTATELAWWVDPEARSSGAGIRLVRHFEQWARFRGARCASLCDLVIDGQEQPAADIINRLGYRVVERASMKELR